MTRQQIENDPMTVELKKDLKQLRESLLDYLIYHEPDETVSKSLESADRMISRWVKRFIDDLAQESELYTEIGISIMQPVKLVMDEREGVFSGMDNLIDTLTKERDEAVEALEAVRDEIEKYYGV